MENTSKALLIAAAVLIVIILIAFGMKVLNSSKDVSEDAQGVGESISDAGQLAVSKLETSFNKGGTTPVQATMWHDNGNGSYTKGNIKKEIGDTFENVDVLKLTGGTAKDYMGTWTVIGIENGKLKLVSTENVIDDVYLGLNDPKAKIAVPQGNNLEKARWSYENAVNTLNSYAKEATGIASARSIKIEDINTLLGRIPGEGQKNYGKVYQYKYENGKIYSYVKNSDGNFVYNGGGEYELFVDNNGIKIDSSNPGQTIELTQDDFYYSTNFSPKEYADIIKSSKRYWLASPGVVCYKNDANFCVRNVSSSPMIYYNLFSSHGGVNVERNGVRAIVYI